MSSYALLPSLARGLLAASHRRGGEDLGLASSTWMMRAMSTKAPSAGGIIEVTSKDHFDRMVVQKSASSLVVAYFTAAWCGPCRAMQPVLDSLATKLEGQVSIVKVDIDHEGVNKVVQAHNISGVPTYCFYKGGKMVESFTGARRDLLQTTIDKLK